MKKVKLFLVPVGQLVPDPRADLGQRPGKTWETSHAVGSTVNIAMETAVFGFCSAISMHRVNTLVEQIIMQQLRNIKTFIGRQQNFTGRQQAETQFPFFSLSAFAYLRISLKSQRC